MCRQESTLLTRTQVTLEVKVGLCENFCWLTVKLVLILIGTTYEDLKVSNSWNDLHKLLSVIVMKNSVI